MWLTHSGFPSRHRVLRAWLVILSMVLLMTPVACTRHTSSTRAGAPAPTPSVTASPATSSPSGAGGGGGSNASAADQLVNFFAAAQRVDGQLRNAAVLVNGGISKTAIQIDPATARAVEAIDAYALAKLIPGGVDTVPSLANSVLLVYSDLVSRDMALSRVERYGGRTLLRSGSEASDLMQCLGGGGPAAARFNNDLAAAKSQAAAIPPLDKVALDSRHAANIAVRAAYIDLANSGCDSCGGYVMTTPLSVVWTSPSTTETSFRVDGTVSGVPFQADDKKGDGWQVQLMAC